MRIRHLAAGALAAAVAALAACSSSPDQSSSTDEAFVLRTCRMFTPPLGCWDSAYSGGASIEPGSSLVHTFGCQVPQNYQYGVQPSFAHPDGRVTEHYAICPKSLALDSWIANVNADPHTTLRMLGIHENASVCNSCLAPAPSGHVYVLWTDIGAVPTCQGGCAVGSGWW
jgi:hypothetical protein